MTNDELIARAEDGPIDRALVVALIAALKASEARVKELEGALVKSRRIMASRQPDKLSDGVYICDKALKGGAE